MLGSSRGCTPGQIAVKESCLIRGNSCGKVIVYLLHDGGEEDPVDLNRQDEREVEEQGGGVSQEHLEVFSDLTHLFLFQIFTTDNLQKCTGNSDVIVEVFDETWECTM